MNALPYDKEEEEENVFEVMLCRGQKNDNLPQKKRIYLEIILRLKKITLKALFVSSGYHSLKLAGLSAPGSSKVSKKSLAVMESGIYITFLAFIHKWEVLLKQNCAKYCKRLIGTQWSVHCEAS